MLSATQLRELVDCAIQNGIEPLVEFFSEKNAAAVIDSKARLIGINTRDLRTLKMVPDNVKKLAQLLPADRVLVAESGIKNKDEINELKSINVSAVLVGESLLRQENLEQAVRNLVSTGK
jgi:indole-3-glycerol phosphate synthase